LTETSMTSAPGKLVLIGEYAVLEGGRALVGAVNRRAKGERVSLKTEAQYSEVVKAVVARAGRSGHGIEGGMAIDTSAFSDAHGNKLGLGSSSAVAVIAASLVCGRGDETVLEIAIDAHREALGGSGIDVAACYYGGVIATRKQPSPVIPLASRMRNLAMSVLFTGESASTKTFVEKTRAAATWNGWCAQMKLIAEDGIRAWEQQNEPAFLSAIARYARAMHGLGRDAGVPIVTEQIAAMIKLADEARTAALKPSGAGGGDVVVMWSRDPDLSARIAEKTGATVLDLTIDQRGLARK
jgi:phosphomevalonate kinase